MIIYIILICGHANARKLLERRQSDSLILSHHKTRHTATRHTARLILNVFARQSRREATVPHSLQFPTSHVTPLPTFVYFTTTTWSKLTRSLFTRYIFFLTTHFYILTIHIRLAHRRRAPTYPSTPAISLLDTVSGATLLIPLL